MNILISSNLREHPGRTLASISGVAVGVVLVVLTTGLVRGMLSERGRRDANLSVELMVSRREQNGISLTTLPASLPVETLEAIKPIPGVAAVTPVGQYLESSGEGAFGLRQVDGVRFDEYSRINGIHIVEGSPLPESGDVMIVDIKYAAARKIRPGAKIDLLGREFTIIGIYAPETGSRMMIPLATMQEALGTRGKCSMILVKCSEPARQEEVARLILESDPDFRVLLTRDLPVLFASGFSGLNVFLNVVAGVAAAISLLVISLTMYSTVTERTRQIGILKSLGASRVFIASVFIRESLAISLIGAAGGLAVSASIRAILGALTDIRIELEPGLLILVTAGGLVSGIAGAVYPAIRAAGLDAVEALGYE